MPSDKHLFQILKSGDSGAFREVYKSCFRRATTPVLRHGGSQTDADDIFQEALFVLVKKLREPDFEIQAQVSTYLYGIVRNLWFKKMRDQNAETPTEDATLLRLRHDESLDDWRWLEQAAEREHQYAHVLKALEQLDEGCRQIILKTYIEDLSDMEIATEMEYQLAFVKVKRFRCMNKLRTILKTLND